MFNRAPRVPKDEQADQEERRRRQRALDIAYQHMIDSASRHAEDMDAGRNEDAYMESQLTFRWVDLVLQETGRA